MSEFHVREAPSSEQDFLPRVKPSPKKSKIPGSFSYTASDDGTDENLLILLHGLGDTELPFSKMGKSLKLPQTAVLALRAPEQVPFLYEEAYQWYTSFDDLGETITRPNPTPALQFLSKVIDHLMKDCAWPISRIHFFGFAQGGSVAAEFGIYWWKLQSKSITSGNTTDGTQTPAVPSFGSIVSVSGPLLSYPTLPLLCPTPVLIVHRSPPADTALPSDAIPAFKKGYQNVTESKLGPKPAGMPASRQEWEPIMRFWSQHLSKRQISGLYEVLSGSGVP
ncbi:putative hydrolase [Psilocybe cubensis]|uniref:Hydrolase n=2 Tax=Psilocybe cubensis TaxID=181762 RepID=A0ACB8GHE4_PSICU|nr:putative hydrolase [Psilocybe cubensis]KAH9474827.1 putative hydrolase [Psilocybe cubensis]